MQQAFRALYNRNYRAFFIGQSVSAVGTWMQNIAMSWLIYRLTDSAWMLGLVAFMNQIPSFILSPIAGVWIDRWRKNRVLIWTQALSLLQSLLLAGLTLTGKIEIWQVLWLSLFLGCINAFDVPARQAATVEMITDPEDKQNAIAVNSITYNTARLVGPSLAGILLPVVGEGICFLLNSISYGIFVIYLALVKITISAETKHGESIFQCFREGFVYAFGQMPLRYILLLLGVVSLTAVPAYALLPVFVSKNLAGGAGTFGYLMAVSGVGSLLGAVFFATRSTFTGFDRLLAAAAGVIGLSLIGFQFVHNIWLCAILLFFLGLGFVVLVVGSNTLLQSLVDDSLRGRIMSFYTMVFMGLGPIGSLLVGAAAEYMGIVVAFRIGGVCCVIASLLFFRRLSIFRRKACSIYLKSGSIHSYDQCSL